MFDHYSQVETTGYRATLIRLRACAVGLVSLACLFTSQHALAKGADGKFEKRTSSHFVLYQDVDIAERSGLRGSRRFESKVLDVLEIFLRVQRFDLDAFRALPGKVF